MAIHVLAVHSDTVRTEQVAGGSLAAAYSVGVFCWLLSAGVYIAAKWVSSEMPPWTLCFWRVLVAWAILMPIVYRHFGAMIALVRARGLELLAIGGMGLAICQGLIFVGLGHADATTAGIIIALIPIITMILARFILAEPMGRWQVVGSIPGGAVMYYLFNRSIEALGAARAGVLLYIQTIFIAVLAYLFLGEQLQRYHLEGAALIIAGLLLIMLLKPTNRAEATRA